jgi:hypothetical protein
VADAKQAWEQVVEGFSELGKVLKEQFSNDGGTEQTQEQTPPQTPPRATESGAAEPSAATDEAQAAGGATGAGSGEGAASGTGRDAGSGSTSSGDGRAVADALNALADAARRLGETATSAVNDPALRDTAVKVADRLGAALSATVEEVSVGLRTHAEARRNQKAQSEQGPWAQAAEDGETPPDEPTP